MMGSLEFSIRYHNVSSLDFALALLSNFQSETQFTTCVLRKQDQQVFKLLKQLDDMQHQQHQQETEEVHALRANLANEQQFRKQQEQVVCFYALTGKCASTFQKDVLQVLPWIDCSCL